jgi:hypothetical protein
MKHPFHWAACAAALMLAGCGGGGSTDGSDSMSKPLAAKTASESLDHEAAASLSIVSSSARYVSGGDARIAVQAPPGLRDKLELWLNGRKIGDAQTLLGEQLEGVVAGFVNGDNVLQQRHRSGPLMDSLALTNYPITGPIYSGPQQYPFVCTTTQSAVGKQPKVETALPPGHAVIVNGQKVGYS